MAGQGDAFYVRARQPQPRWQPFLFKSGAGAGSLAELVLGVPGFLNLADESAARFHAVVSIANLCRAKGETLAAVDEAGHVFVVGCPDERQSSPYGTVVADVLAASGRLWRMEYDVFSGLFREATGRWLEEIVMPRARADWDFDRFKPAVERSLANGKFPVLILTARPTGPVEETINYLAAMNLQARAAGALLEEHGGIESAVPIPAAGFKFDDAQPWEAGGAGSVFGFPRRPEPGFEPDATTALEPTEPTSGTGPQAPAGAAPTSPARYVARPPGPGTKPGVMAGKRPPPKPPGAR